MAYKAYNSYLQYCENSIIMQVVGQNVPSCYMDYYVDTHYKAEYPVIEYGDPAISIVATYGQELLSEEFCLQAANAIGIEDSYTYISEYITVSALSDNAFRVRIIALNLDDCSTLSELVDGRVSELKSECSEVYGSFDVENTAKIQGYRIDNAVLEGQKAILGQVGALKGNMDNTFSTLNPNQKNYYNACVEHMNLLDDETVEVVDEVETVSTPKSSTKKIYPKFIVIGAILGAFLACGWYMMKYLLSSALRNKQDVESAFGFRMLGSVAATPKRKIFGFIDKLVDKIFYGKGPKFTEEERMDMITAGIRITANKNSYDSVYVTGTSNDAETERVQDTILEKLKAAGITVAKGTSVLYDPESLEKMADSSAVVFVERVGKSLNEDIVKEKQLAKEYDIPVIGAVAIDA